MRLFSAVLPPEGAVRELAAEVAGLRTLPGADRLRWTGRADWHFTLAFYGEVHPELLPELCERLARAARRHPPYPLRIAGGGRFADRVVWAGAEGGRPAMGRLADSASAAARRAGVPMKEQRPYAPHLTLARNRTAGVDLRPFVAGIEGFRGQEWTVGELVLVRSHLPVDGVAGQRPRYETVAAWPLGNRDGRLRSKGGPQDS
ncbi:RNA 2',3'-cyclic phosphodiesterase [Streptomyces sp. MST-110588]|uniref:RNA 2',3'-cyclic phosphodiesterase n=1 Tax=Streptomyces sp. MST-110588 TaxID=2833628 RepID=UPI001F5D2379|nr:RNA 2',3'-cyclic phosphodiesterase [Streptomyces sp. MST-110588]UNO40403.1 RNA 2',3'-cyclic phosphodiesterase [Streptomyces sp. MST-110588]